MMLPSHKYGRHKHHALFFTHSVSYTRTHTHTHTHTHTERERESSGENSSPQVVNQSRSKSPAKLLTVCCIFVYFSFPGARFNKEVQPTRSLNLNSELSYSEMGNSEFSVTEQLNCVSLLNSK